MCHETKFSTCFTPRTIDSSLYQMTWYTQVQASWFNGHSFCSEQFYVANIICIFFQIYDFAKTVNFRHVDCYCNLSKPVSYLKTPFLFNEKNVSSIIWYLEYHANSQFEFQYFFLLGQIYRYIIFDIM